MITPEKFNKIVNKLPKDKTELAKVELSVADDLKKVVASGKDMMTRIKKFKDEIKADNKLNSDLDTIFPKRSWGDFLLDFCTFHPKVHKIHWGLFLQILLAKGIYFHPLLKRSLSRLTRSMKHH